MSYHIQPMKICELRIMVSRAVREEPTPSDLIQAARESLQVMCREAALYGLTTADVVRALFRPVFEERRCCDCQTCETHQLELEEEALPY